MNSHSHFNWILIVTAVVSGFVSIAGFYGATLFLIWAGKKILE